MTPQSSAPLAGGFTGGGPLVVKDPALIVALYEPPASGVFDSPYEQFAEHRGKRFEYLGVPDGSEFVEDYGDALFLIRLESGEEIHAWPEEIIPWFSNFGHRAFVDGAEADYNSRGTFQERLAKIKAVQS